MRAIYLVLFFVFFFYRAVRVLSVSSAMKKQSWRVELNIYEGCAAFTIRWETKVGGAKQDKRRIHLSILKKVGKNGRDWCSLIGTSMKNSESTHDVMCSRCRIEVTNCDESMLSPSSLRCQDTYNQTFLISAISKLKTHDNINISHILYSHVFYIFIIW